MEWQEKNCILPNILYSQTHVYLFVFQQQLRGSTVSMKIRSTSSSSDRDLHKFGSSASWKSSRSKETWLTLWSSRVEPHGDLDSKVAKNLRRNLPLQRSVSQVFPDTIISSNMFCMITIKRTQARGTRQTTLKYAGWGWVEELNLQVSDFLYA